MTDERVKELVLLTVNKWGEQTPTSSANFAEWLVRAGYEEAKHEAATKAPEAKPAKCVCTIKGTKYETMICTSPDINAEGECEEPVAAGTCQHKAACHATPAPAKGQVCNKFVCSDPGDPLRCDDPCKCRTCGQRRDEHATPTPDVPEFKLPSEPETAPLYRRVEAMEDLYVHLAERVMQLERPQKAAKRGRTKQGRTKR